VGKKFFSFITADPSMGIVATVMHTKTRSRVRGLEFSLDFGPDLPSIERQVDALKSLLDGAVENAREHVRVAGIAPQDRDVSCFFEGQRVMICEEHKVPWLVGDDEPPCSCRGDVPATVVQVDLAARMIAVDRTHGFLMLKVPRSAQ
jgi:hypothetical protein